MQKLNYNLTRKITLLSTTLVILPLVAFLFLTLAPALSPDSVSATSETSEVAVGIDEVLSLRIVKQNSSTGEWDVDTDTISARAAHGEFGSAMVKVIASTNGRGGYQLSMNDTDSNNKLVSAATLDEIPALASSITLDNITDTTEKFTAGRWGYSWAKNNGDNSSLTFNAMPTTETLMDNTSDLGVNTYNFTLGVRATETTPAATYTDQIMFSLVGNPAPDSPLFYRTEYMQNFTPQICDTVKTPLASTTNVTADNGSDYSYSGGYATKVPSTKIKDARDEQEYTIRKLADGNCWMTENLRFGATTNTAADTPNPWFSTTDPATNTATTTDGAAVMGSAENGLISSHIITVNDNAKGADDSAAFSNTAEYYTKPYITIYKANTTDTVSGTGTKFGALYNYCAATGGTACTARGNTPTVSGSICPTNWTFPAFTAEVNVQDGTAASYNNLTYTYGIGYNTAAGVTTITSAPLSFPRAGYFSDGSLSYRYASGGGFYWSSTPDGGTSAYNLYFYGSAYIHRDSSMRRFGRSVRCVVEA